MEGGSDEERDGGRDGGREGELLEFFSAFIPPCFSLPLSLSIFIIFIKTLFLSLSKTP